MEDLMSYSTDMIEEALLSVKDNTDIYISTCLM